MAIGKEQLHMLSSLAAQQSRIYDDACDVGLWETPERKAVIKEALEYFKALEGVRSTQWEGGTSCETRVGFEMDEGLVSGNRIRVTRSYDRRSRKYFFTIEIAHAFWEPNSPVHIFFVPQVA